MMETIRRSVALPRLRVDYLATATTTLAFAWLLINDHIHPLAVYLLQLYLAF
jgi:hypothetical protein